MPSFYDYIETCNSLALFGGTFDPIHNGHLAIAEEVYRLFHLNKLLFVPAGDPPHKFGEITNSKHRMQMILHAIAGYPQFDVSSYELNRMGKSYTIDTVNYYKSILPKKSKLYFILGADSLENITSWKNYEELLTACEFVCVTRPGESDTIKTVKRLAKRYDATIHLLDSINLQISSTEIRRRMNNGLSPNAYVQHRVLDYAKETGLYGFDLSLSNSRFEEIKHILAQEMSSHRFKHTLGTIIEAEKLAAHYGVNLTKARFAALLHDSAKEYSSAKKLFLCKEWNIPLDDTLLTAIDITHGMLGAESAKRNFNIQDEEILNAVRFHTTGRKNMSMLDKIIMLADYIEPYRQDYEPLEEIRKYAYIDINKALSIGINSTNNDLINSGRQVHVNALDALKDLGY